MALSKRKLGLYSTGGCLVIALVMVLLNLLSFRHFFRLDCTENKIYSLSPATRNILTGLTDPLRIRIFFEENLPPEYAHQRRYLEELLQEMATSSVGKMRVEFADMKKPDAREEAQRAGIATLRFTAVRKDKFEVQEGMMGLVMYYEDKHEVMPALTQISNIEYELAGRVVKLTQKARPVVGWTTGNGEIDPPEALSQYLSQNFELRRLDRLNAEGWGKSGLEGISALMVAGPKLAFSDTGLRSLDRAILSGVPTALLLDLYDVQMGNFFARKTESGLERLLKSYGIIAKDGLVVDAQNVPVQVQTQQGFFTMQTLVNYPYIPRLTEKQLSRDHPVTRTLQEIALPFVSPLDIADSSSVAILARSSPESFRMVQPFMVSPMQPIDVAGAEPGPFILGLSIQGSRRSAFTDTASGDVRLLVFSNAAFLDESRGGGAGNLTLAANLVDWLAATEDLISIRSKGNTHRPLEKVSDRKRNLIKASNLFLMPLIVALMGLIRWQLRRARRRRWETAEGS